MKCKIKGIIVSTLMFFFFVFSGNVSAAGVFTIDKTHSTLGFAVKHLEVSLTRGVFTDFSGEIKFDRENLDEFSADVVIQAKSIDSGLQARDEHLRNPHFFDVENNPTITFKSEKIRKEADRYIIVGDLTILGISKKMPIPVTIFGPIKSPFGGEIMGVSGEATIDRLDFGMSWNNPMPEGGFVVGNKVKLIIDIEAYKK